MCPSWQRADALNALTLVENIARLSTQGLFGFVFAALATVGKSYLTFFCNAVSFLLHGAATLLTLWQAIAFLAAAVLLLSHFAPEGSRQVETDEDGEAAPSNPLALDDPNRAVNGRV